MTVIDIFLDRQRPNLVEKEKISQNRKRKSSMQDIQGCGNLIIGDTKNISSMEGNGIVTQLEGENHLIR